LPVDLADAEVKLTVKVRRGSVTYFPAQTALTPLYQARRVESAFWRSRALVSVLPSFRGTADAHGGLVPVDIEALME